MKLVSAESVARSIAAVLDAADQQDSYLQSNGYIVIWCISHLARLADSEQKLLSIVFCKENRRF